MKRNIVVDFPDDFSFPEHFDLKACQKCYFFEDYIDDCNSEGCFIIGNVGGKCPLYGKNEDEQINL